MYRHGPRGVQEMLPQDPRQQELWADSQAVADMKFTYVVSCQVYGQQKQSKIDARDRSCYQNILNLMLE